MMELACAYRKKHARAPVTPIIIIVIFVENDTVTRYVPHSLTHSLKHNNNTSLRITEKTPVEWQLEQNIRWKTHNVRT